ncbi:MAG: hypothetical protein FJ271_23065 [Planctomycetes bacterium]|nr:hypothetical protein [Planctomycetota bacterium]
MTNLFHRITRWLARKAPSSLAGTQWHGPRLSDLYQRMATPSPRELLAELKSTAWTCATINSSVCASYPPRLYVATRPGQPTPRCLTRRLATETMSRLRDSAHLKAHTRTAAAIEEVVEHPLLDLLRQVNPVHNGFDS